MVVIKIFNGQNLVAVQSLYSQDNTWNQGLLDVVRSIKTNKYFDHTFGESL